MNEIFNRAANHNPTLSSAIQALWNKIKKANQDHEYWDFDRVLSEATEIAQKAQFQENLDAMFCIPVPPYSRMNGVTAHGEMLVLAAEKKVQEKIALDGEPTYIQNCQSGAVNYFWQ